MKVGNFLSGFGDGLGGKLEEMPHWFRLAWNGSLLGAILIFMLTALVSCAGELISPMLPATGERLENAKREVEMERLRLEKNSQISISNAREQAEKAKILAEAEAYARSLGVQQASQEADPTRSLSALANLITTHLSTILTLMFAGHLLPTFARTGDPTRLVLNIAIAIVLSGVFALVNGALSPTVASIKLDIFSMQVSSSSIACVLIAFGAVLAGFSHYSLHRTQSACVVSDS